MSVPLQPSDSQSAPLKLDHIGTVTLKSRCSAGEPLRDTVPSANTWQTPVLERGPQVRRSVRWRNGLARQVERKCDSLGPGVDWWDWSLEKQAAYRAHTIKLSQNAFPLSHNHLLY